MVALKYSRQRLAIKNYLMSTKSHPTADEVYMNVRKEYPNISLGTVYRNLALLVDMKEAVKVPSNDGFDHFDGDTSRHYHCICKECGKITDISMEIVGDLLEIKDKVNQNTECEVLDVALHFNGICGECKVKM